MNTFGTIELRAGKAAYESIMDAGLQPDMIKIMAGAAGGPKWIVLGQLDTFIFGEWFRGRKKPLHMISSSIGAWRFASAMAYEDPLRGLAEFKEGYFGQRYSSKPSREEIAIAMPKVMDAYINAETIPRILNHPYARLHMLAVRGKGFLGSENKLIQGTGLVGAILGNMLSRNSLGIFFERYLFADPRDTTEMFGLEQFNTHIIKTTPDNFLGAILATSSIPMVMNGITDIVDAPKGTYRDGGLIDYHLTFPYQLSEGEIVFQPHFFDQVKPSWFDKKLSYRKASEAERNHVLLVYPSEEFRKKLPGGSIPDRNDFVTYETDERIKRWEEVHKMCERVRDDFAELVLSGKIREKLKLWKD